MGRVLRIGLVAFVVALVLPAPAAAEPEAVTLSLEPAVAPYGSAIRLAVAVEPAARVRVGVFHRVGTGWRWVAEGLTTADGTISLPATARTPGPYVARAAGVESPWMSLRIRPLLPTRLRGPAVLGAPLFLTGRLRPRASAGTLRLTVAGRTRAVELATDGRFRERLPTGRVRTLMLALVLDPAPGYTTVRRERRVTIGTPVLRRGARGPAVRFLERRLRGLAYALLAADRVYGQDTVDAVTAFQKVEGLLRDGVAGPEVWTALLRARTPAPGVVRGAHLEVNLARQVVFEVRRGRVLRIANASTGATGNTPLGRFRVYLKTPGFNSLGMYYSLYFLRGFAVHGYASVPPYPASHGCVRVPLWFARGLYSRWPLGSLVRIRSGAAAAAANPGVEDVRAPADSSCR